MRRLLMEALQFPRNYLRSSLFLQECRHGGHFQVGDQRCENCPQKQACHWLYLNDERINAGSKSVSELVRSLEFPLEYIDVNIANAGHDIGTCFCATCLWLKNAENLLSLNQRKNSPCYFV